MEFDGSRQRHYEMLSVGTAAGVRQATLSAGFQHTGQRLNLMVKHLRLDLQLDHTATLFEAVQANVAGRMR